MAIKRNVLCHSSIIFWIAWLFVLASKIKISHDDFYTYVGRIFSQWNLKIKQNVDEYTDRPYSGFVRLVFPKDSIWILHICNITLSNQRLYFIHRDMCIVYCKIIGQTLIVIGHRVVCFSVWYACFFETFVV